MSINLADISSELPLPCSNLNLLLACNGVKFSNRILFFVLDEVSELIVSIFNKAKYLSLSLGGLILPCIVSPVRNENFLIWLGDTYISSGPARYELSADLRNPKPSCSISRTPPPDISSQLDE
jgi:hypothetical protein